MDAAKAYSVLIVEDERIVAMDLQQALASMGYDAYAIASSAEEAMSRASERCPDLVLMDIRIKGRRDGIETAALLRDTFGVPVVYLSAHADTATLDRAKQTHPYGYLMKPVRTAELRSTVEVSIFRHQMEKRERERERGLASTTQAVIMMDLRGVITFINAGAEEVIGITAKQAVGQPIRDLPWSTPRPAPARGVVHSTPTPTELDVASGVVEQQLHQHQRELADRLASLGTMAAGMAHEVNNPLAVVVANASYVLDELRHQQGLVENGTPRLAEAILAQSELEAAANRISRVIAELRAFARPAQPIPGEADVAFAIESALRTTADEFRGRTNVVAQIDLIPRVKLDALRLEQILVNLLMNAAHATPLGHLPETTVSVTAHAHDNVVVIEVRDGGAGIAREVLDRVFEPFFTTKGVGAGAGLGLAVCHGIITSVGGRIDVETEVGRGSMFRVTLPAVPPVPLVAVTVVESAGAFRRGRILTIDDDRMVLNAMNRMLRNHDVVCIEDARLVIPLLDSGDTFDLILSDLMMPHLTGRELYEQLLVAHPKAARQVVFMTGGVMTAALGDFLAVVPNVCLTKPLFAKTLHAFIQTRLAEATQGGPL